MADTRIGRPLTRREFNSASISALFVGMTVWMGGCGGSGGSSASPAAPTSASGASPAGSGDRAGVVSANHGHVATVTSAALQAGGAVALNIRGAADHDHTLQLTLDDVRQVAAGARVTGMTSEGGGTDDGYGGSTGGHTHSVTFN